MLRALITTSICCLALIGCKDSNDSTSSDAKTTAAPTTVAIPASSFTQTRPENVKDLIEVKKNAKTGEVTERAVDGVFIAIGHDPNTKLFQGQLTMDDEGYLITKPDSTKTNIDGVYAAGDVQDKVFRQAVTAAGTGCMAALEAEHFLAAMDATQAAAE